jgi:hypothetical protein
MRDRFYYTRTEQWIVQLSVLTDDCAEVYQSRNQHVKQLKIENWWKIYESSLPAIGYSHCLHGG